MVSQSQAYVTTVHLLSHDCFHWVPFQFVHRPAIWQCIVDTLTVLKDNPQGKTCFYDWISELWSLTPTSRIVEKNPSKFKIDNKELSSRKSFIDQTREEVKVSVLTVCNLTTSVGTRVQVRWHSAMCVLCWLELWMEERTFRNNLSKALIKAKSFK
jgi:hypothetical protein